MKRKKQTNELQYQFCPSCKSTMRFKIIENYQVLGCSQCSFLFWNNPLPVVSALIIQNGKVLLIKRKGVVYNGYWALPGGIINYLEEPHDALKREVFEETGIVVNNAILLDSYLIIYGPNGLEKHPSHTSIDLIYNCYIKKDIARINTISNNTEISEIKIFSINKLPKLIAFKHREIIIKHLLNI
jgi:ADP-ribose pyrophosphatase YjhB (NUDIX family)